jgi:hypothetical protein
MPGKIVLFYHPNPVGKQFASITALRILLKPGATLRK